MCRGVGVYVIFVSVSKLLDHPTTAQKLGGESIRKVEQISQVAENQ